MRTKLADMTESINYELKSYYPFYMDMYISISLNHNRGLHILSILIRNERYSLVCNVTRGKTKRINGK